LGELSAALRSGEFTQTSQALKRKLLDGTYAHCVLGVACEIADIETLSWEDGEGDTLNLREKGGEARVSVPPLSVQDHYGFTHAQGFRVTIDRYPQLLKVGRGPTFLLATLNDYGVPFEVLADLIDDFRERS